MRERQGLEDGIKAVKGVSQALEDNIGLIELGEEEGDQSVVEEAEAAIRSLAGEVKARQIETMLSGEADANDTYLEIHAGAGGTESQDWASMLLRMYTRWAERRRFKVEVLEVHDGEEAGIKSATMLIKGHNAYGWLKTESGVHRLVRISPYDSNARRHTSFASVWVYPVIDDSIEIEVSEFGCAHRHLSFVGRRRPARQHDGFGGAHHAPPDRHRGRLPGRALAAQEQGEGLGDAALAALRGRAEEARGRGQRHRGGEDRHRLGPPDPLLRAAALSAGEGPAHRRGEHQPV